MISTYVKVNINNFWSLSLYMIKKVIESLAPDYCMYVVTEYIYTSDTYICMFAMFRW